MVSRKTLQRKVGAALLEKTLQMYQERWKAREGHLLALDPALLGFEINRFLAEYDFKDVTVNKGALKSGYDPIIEENNAIALKDYIESVKCRIRPFNFKCLLEKKENLLYSKNEQKYKVARKDLKKRARIEDDVLGFVDHQISHNTDFKLELDLSDKNVRKESKPQSEHSWVDITEILYDLCKTFIFHNDWELRHGALMYMRAFSRVFKSMHFIAQLPPDNLSDSNFKLCSELIYQMRINAVSPDQENSTKIQDIQKELEQRLVSFNPQNLLDQRCEDVKNRCIILLSVDRFSDFLADKSNIINRALASEVLVNVYELSPNLAENLFIFEHLLQNDIKSGWEPKQAVFFLLTKILEAQTKAYNSRERRQKKLAKRERRLKKQKKRATLKQSPTDNGAWETQLTKNYQSVAQNLGKSDTNLADQLNPSPQIKSTKPKRRVNKKYKQLENLKLMEKELEFETYLTQKSKKFAKGPVIGAGSLQALLSHIPRVLKEHEEIAEACCELMLEVLHAPYLNIKEVYWKDVQAQLNPVLQNCEDISYLPKSSFEFLSGIISKNIQLDSALVASLHLHLNKFMFHDNSEVRAEVYRFVFTLFSKPLYASQISSEHTEALFLTFFFYSALSEVSFAQMAGFDDILNVHPLLLETQKSSKKSLSTNPKDSELTKICNILFSMFQSMDSKRNKIFALMLDSLDIISLEKFYEKCQCGFKFNSENFVTEADPQKMIFIVFSILKGMQPGVIKQLFEHHIGDFGKIDLKTPSQKIRISTLTLMSLLSIQHRNPDFFSSQTAHELLKTSAQPTHPQPLFTAPSLPDLAFLSPSHAHIQFISKELATLVPQIEMFLSTNFGPSKVIAPSPPVQNHIVSILMLIQSQSLHGKIADLRDACNRLGIQLRQEAQQGRLGLIKTNMVLSALEDSILRPIIKLSETFDFFINFSKCVGAVLCNFAFLTADALPPRKQVNGLVAPFLALIKRPLIPIVSRIVSKGLFLLHLVYRNEAKHPNSKIVKTLVKNMAFDAPKDGSEVRFFPTPENDLVSFGNQGSLPNGFMKNTKETDSLKIGLSEFRKAQMHERTPELIHSSTSGLLESSELTNFTHFKNKNIQSLTLAPLLNKALLTSNNPSDSHVWTSFALESVTSFFTRKNAGEYLSLILQFKPPLETLTKYQPIHCLFQDDYLFTALAPWIFKAAEPFASLAAQAHIMHPFFNLHQNPTNPSLAPISRQHDSIRKTFLHNITQTYQIAWSPQLAIISPFYKMTHIFENLYHCDVPTASMFLSTLFELIQNRSTTGLKILAYIFKRYKRHAIHISTVFVCEILKALNDPRPNIDKALICECFCLTLTLAYIEPGTLDTGKIFEKAIQETPHLHKQSQAGIDFLFDFKNYKNFEVDIPLWLLQGGLVLRDYQLEGVKWLNFLWKYELNGVLCDDMGLGKTLQTLVTVALQILEINRPRNLTDDQWSELKTQYSMQLNKQARKELQQTHSLNPKQKIHKLIQLSKPFQKWDQVSETVALVICPNSIVYHWKKEAEQKLAFGALSPTILSKQLLSSLKRPNLTSLLSQSPRHPQLLIAGYSFIKSNFEFFDQEIAFVILDEAHMIKNEKTVLAKAVKTLRARRKLGLTGTPIQNNVLELWSIFDFVMPGYLNTKKVFRKDHKELMNMSLMSLELDKMKLSQAQKRKLEFLHAKVLPFIMRRIKKDVLKDLPPKIIQDYACEMTDFQRRLYDIFTANELRFLPLNQIPDKTGQTHSSNMMAIETEDNSPPRQTIELPQEEKQSVLKTLSSLRKIVNHPFLLEKDPLYASSIATVRKQLNKSQKKNYFFLGGKFIALQKILESLAFEPNDVSSCSLNSNKLIIFSRIVASCEMIIDFFKQFFPFIKTKHLHNGLNLKQRADLVEEYNLDPHCKVIVMTPKIGGLGLNLASANVVLMFDHDFNPMNDLQAMDRAHRLGQKKCVNVYRLVTQNSHEEKIMGIQQFKLSVANTVINFENASIKNVKDAGLVGLMKDLAETYQNTETGQEDEQYASLNKKLRLIGAEDEWGEDEYTQEFID